MSGNERMLMVRRMMIDWLLLFAKGGEGYEKRIAY